MKSTGIVRRIDDLGRVVISMELRRTMEIAEGDPLEVFVDGDFIMLRKYAPGCVFCGATNELKPFKNKLVFASCAEELPKWLLPS